MIYTAEYSSPLGKMLLSARGDSLTGLWFEGQKYFPGGDYFKESAPGSGGALADAAAWLDAYFSGQRPAPSELRLSPDGSDFAKSVWRILCSIPYGGLCTYGEIAERLAAETGRGSMSAQAVGGAVGHNPISVIIPCHRVIGRDGSLTGYAGGLDRKRALLTLEGHDPERLGRTAQR